jgi:serine O-acetyltransferase
MTYKEFKYLLRADLFRYRGRGGLGEFLMGFLSAFQVRYCFFFRFCSMLHGRWFALPVYLVARLIFQHCIYKYGVEIAPRTQIGPGLHIGHFGGILVSNAAKIGRNCNLSHEVTIGLSSRGERAGVPTLGDNVYIGPGAKIFGAITIGNNVAIGANAVVTHDVPDNAVVAGIPAKIISIKGSQGYIANTDYD